MNLAKRVESLPPYLFAEISKKIAAKRAEGHDVVTFGIGDPDLPTPKHIMDVLHRESNEPINHRYPESEGLPELRQAISDWYFRRFETRFDPEKECLPLIGSKEGIGHVALCFIDPGDLALVPDPGYPVYEIGTMFAGGETVKVPCTREGGWLVDFESIPANLADRAKIIWLNYPNNPTGGVADVGFFERAVAWAKQHGVAILHDNPYSDVCYDGYQAPTIFDASGARDVAI